MTGESGRGLRTVVGNRPVESSTIPRPVLQTPLVLQVVVTVLTHAHRRRDFQAFDFRLKPTALLAEELAAVPAVVPSFCQRKPHRAARTAVPSFILHPVVSSRAARLVTHRPAEHAASTVPDEDPAVILGDAQGGDLSGVSVVLPIEGRVHS